jgi:hypothetical protein
LEQRQRAIETPVRRLVFLIPDLWPAEDQHRFRHHASPEELADLVERRTGVRPVFDPTQIWAITVPASEEMLEMSEDEKAAYLEQHETRPVPWWLRREQA